MYDLADETLIAAVTHYMYLYRALVFASGITQLTPWRKNGSFSINTR